MVEVSRRLRIRPALSEDMGAVASIYAHYVRSTTVTFETEPPSAAAMAARWDEVRRLGAPYLVAEVAGETVGYAYAGSYRARPAYAHTLENSIYLSHRWTGQGIGRPLLERLVADCAERGFAQLVAVITGGDETPSVHLHRACGFTLAGCLTGVGRKFDRWLDTTLMQRAL